jgi:hypothetical protein
MTAGWRARAGAEIIDQICLENEKFMRRLRGTPCEEGVVVRL